MKSFDELQKEYEMATLNDKEYNEIVENENVESVTCNDEGGFRFGKCWYTADDIKIDKDGYQREFDFYMQTEKGE